MTYMLVGKYIGIAMKPISRDFDLYNRSFFYDRHSYHLSLTHSLRVFSDSRKKRRERRRKNWPKRNEKRLTSSKNTKEKRSDDLEYTTTKIVDHCQRI